MAEQPADVDAYLATFPPEVAARLQRVRAAIHDVLPDAPEKMRYGIAAVQVGGRYWLHFAGWKRHIGLYPVPRADGELEADIAPWRAAKDTVNLPHDRDLPIELIRRITQLVVDRQAAAVEASASEASDTPS
ncbi:iron chaperone [Agromyces sp. MMS24-K17]|uniref:iron chaperone n=1 Tax=Agromyces sp. MMS24-K17 TaxID=3372850 RepID=UPI00375479F3